MSKPSTKTDKPSEGYPYHTIWVGGGWDPFGAFVLFVIAAMLIYGGLKVYRSQEPCENANHPTKEVQE